MKRTTLNSGPKRVEIVWGSRGLSTMATTDGETTTPPRSFDTGELIVHVARLQAQGWI